MTEPAQDQDPVGEPDKVEIVDPAERRGQLAVVEAASGVEAAARAAVRAAVEEPGTPGMDEVRSVALMARLLSESDLAPKDIRGKPYNAFLILLTGRALGLDPTAALRKVYVVDGQPSLAPQLLAALVRRQGLGRIVPGERSIRRAEAVPVGPDGVPLGPPVEFTWSDAQIAGLVRADCEPDRHSERCEKMTQQRQRGACKANWRHYPARMCWWRAVGVCADDYFPEVSLGLYTPDELGALTDEDGVPIDPATVELPPGYDEPGSSRYDEPGEVGAADELLDLQVRVAALPTEQRDGLREQWGRVERLRGCRLASLPASRVGLVASLVRALESAAAAGGWDGDRERDAVRERVAVGLCVALSGGFGTPTPPGSPEPVNGPHAAAEAALVEDGGLDGIDAVVTGEVRSLTSKEVDAALEDRGLDTSGSVQARRRRLVDAVVAERLHG